MNARKACLSERLGLALLFVGLRVFCGHVLAAPVPPLATGASVDEARVQNVYYVDVASADAANDDKHGTADAPFATISYACGVAIRDKERNIGAKVLVAPGVYRETVEIHSPVAGAADTDAPFVIEAAERGQAVIDGADTEGWTPSTWKTEGEQWTHPWPFRRNPAQQAVWDRLLHTSGAPPSASGGAFRPGDLVLVDGNIMRQVNRLEDLVPGCFWERAASVPGRATKPAAGTSEAPGGPTVILQPPPDARLADSIIQIGARDHGLMIRGRRSVVVRGLLFEHAAGPVATDHTAAGLLIDGCSNVLVDDVLSEWNDGTGLVVTGRTSAPWSTDVTLRQSHLLHNGSSGLYVANIKNIVVEDTEACFNNFRGEWANWVDAAGPAGVKADGVHLSTWRRLRAVANFCRGVWWAGDNSDVTLEDGAVRGNLVSGLLIEHDPGPLLIHRSLVDGTKSHPSVREETASAAGVSVVASPDVTLESNIVAANAATQLGVWDPPTHAEGTTFENRASKRVLHAERHAYHHNVFYGIDAAQTLYLMPAAEGTGKTPPSFLSTLDAHENCFWNPSQAEVFSVRSAPSKPANAGPANGLSAVNLEGWRAMIAARNPDKASEVGSLWQDPLFADPAEGDYQLGERSPVTEWNLPTDEGSTAP